MNKKRDIVISKTDFLLFRECRKNSWLKLHKPEVYFTGELTEFEKAIIETGNEVELWARKLFPTGILIEGRDERSLERTAELVESKSHTLFQPVFMKDGMLAASDIIQFDPDTNSWTLIEVKASNAVKENLHIADLAFQYVLLKRCGLDIGKVGVLHLNPEYTRQGQLDLIKLFVTDDVTSDIIEILPHIEAEIAEAISYLREDNEPVGPCECVYKGRSSHCTTFSYSNPHIPEYSVHDIARIGMSKRKLTELIDGNIFHVHEVPEHIDLSEIQKNQVDTKISGRPIVRKDKIVEELSKLSFPLYFLDYETYPSAIPRLDGYRPYEQIPFQYSLHIIRDTDDLSKGDENVLHHEFLHTGTDDPAPNFGDSLVKDIGPNGTIVVWNKKFECNINLQLARRIPRFATVVANMNSRVYDLMDIFSKQYMVHADFYGSTSIKYVLPVLAPDLSYKKLQIRDGGSATQKWNEMTTGDISPDDKSTIANDLLTYCRLDTLAMYRIWKYLINL